MITILISTSGSNNSTLLLTSGIPWLRIDLDNLTFRFNPIASIRKVLGNQLPVRDRCGSTVISGDWYQSSSTYRCRLKTAELG